MNKLVQIAATVAAKRSVRRNMIGFDADSVTHQSIYFQLGKALELQEPILSHRVRYLISHRGNCPDPTNVADIIIRESLNQFAAQLPGTTDVCELIKNMFRNSYRSMVDIHNVLPSKSVAVQDCVFRSLLALCCVLTISMFFA